MTVAHFPLTRLQAALKGDGIRCVIRPGAQGRSARRFTTGYYMGCQAVVQHHTVSSGNNPEADIRYIESGKGVGYVIANSYTAVDGTVYLIASGPTYTEGTGGPFGIIPENRANDVAFSNENASWGEPDSVYPARQQDAVLGLAYHAGVIAADVWGWTGPTFAPTRAFAHHEWTSRKVDPRGVSRWSPNGGEWDMNVFRAELSQLQEELMSPRFFKTSAKSPTLWYTTDGITAVHVTEPHWLALGTPQPEVISAAEAAKFAFVTTLQHDIAI